MIGKKSAREANDSQEDFVASRSKLGKLLRFEGPRHTPVRQGLSHFGLQHSDFQGMWGGRPIVQLRAEPFEACLHETDRSV